MQNSYERHIRHLAHFPNMRKANGLQPFVCNAQISFWAVFPNMRRKRVAINARPGTQITCFATSPLQNKIFFSLDTLFPAVGTETFFLLDTFFCAVGTETFF
jgi:hypothetical protein